MKYIDVTKAQSLVFKETNTPVITDDECLIAVKAIGVNRADILQRQGKYPPPQGESPILGIEVCGEIVSCGKSVQGWQAKDKVFCLVPGGAYAQFVKVKASHLMLLPANFQYQQGAAIAECFLTAFQCLFSIANLSKRLSVKDRAQPKILIHAGASGVGTAAIQLAKACNCFVAVTVSNEQKAQACLALGADLAINYQQDNFKDVCKSKGLAFDVIIDVVAGDYVNNNIDITALDGDIVILSMLGGRYCQQLDVAKLLMKRITLHGTTLRNRDDEYKQQLIADFINAFGKQIENQTIKPVIDTIYDWNEVEKAHLRIMNNSNIGKIILTVTD